MNRRTVAATSPKNPLHATQSVICTKERARGREDTRATKKAAADLTMGGRREATTTGGLQLQPLQQCSVKVTEIFRKCG
jgi:hypothetical protein